MLSILIPTFNTSIFELVQGVHDQADQCAIPYEIIVCDDASTKEQPQNKDITRLTNCTYITNKSNKGRTATRSNLAQKAIYDWVLFLDADVFPTSNEFIKNYVSLLENEDTIKCIFGGITYKEEQPIPQEILRWTYGRSKESKPASERIKNSHFIISQNLLIKKELFLEINTFTENQYGLDNIFSHELKRRHIHVVHIDNEVYHLGLESNEIFLQKSIDSLKTTITYEKSGIIPTDLRPVQRIYNKLSAFLNSHRFIGYVIGLFEKQIKVNLTSKKPSMLLFDMYRLYHYIQLKSNA